LLKKSRYKAPEILRNEAYMKYIVISLPRQKVGRDEGNPVGGIDGPFSATG
jgi:hypothetical protein